MQLMILGKIAEKEVEISGKRTCSSTYVWVGYLGNNFMLLPFASVSIFGYSQSVSLMDGGDGIIALL
ncbi:MAG: hypothetical protein ACLRQF_21560 [Thomasclavelia ramosa]